MHVACSCNPLRGGRGRGCSVRTNGRTAEEEHTLVGRPSLQYASGAIRRAIQTHTHCSPIILLHVLQCSAAHRVALNKTMRSGAWAVD